MLAVILDFDDISPTGNSVAYLLDTHFVKESNNITFSQAVIKTAHEYGYEDVKIFSSDNVAYMKLAFRASMSVIFPSCAHITCQPYS